MHGTMNVKKNQCLLSHNFQASPSGTLKKLHETSLDVGYGLQSRVGISICYIARKILPKTPSSSNSNLSSSIQAPPFLFSVLLFGRLVLSEYRTLAVAVGFSDFWFIHSPRAVESGKTMTNYTSRSPRLISVEKEGTQNQVHKKSCKRTADCLILIHDYTLGCLHSVACFTCLNSMQLQ